MPVFYKERGQALPTVVYNGDTFYDFIWDGNVFVCNIDDPKAVKFLTSMGYPVLEETKPELIPALPDNGPSQPARTKVPSK